MDIQQILFFIDDAISNGTSSEQVNQYLSTLPPAVQEEVRLAQTNARGGSAVGDFARMAAQGATFGFADEIIGMFAGDEARERSRQNLSVRRELNPGASLLSEIAGGVVVPVGVVGQGTRAGASTGRLAATGAGVGALEGALFGAGESVEGERGQGALTGGLVGAATGGIAAPVAGAATRAAAPRARNLINRVRGIDPDVPGPGPRVAESLTQRAGIEPNINQALEVADQSLSEISANVFSKLDDKFPEVDSDAVSTYIRGLTDNKDTRSVVGAVSRELRDGNRLPSFSDVQDIRRRLIRKGLGDEADELTDIMEEVFGESFIEANSEWRRLSRIKESMLDGEKAWNLGANQLERRLAGMGDAERAAFQQGRMSEIVQRLQRRDASAVQPLTDFLDAGPSTQRQLRTLFDTDAAFNGFMEELGMVAGELAEKKAADVTQARRLARWLLPAGLAGGASGKGLFDFITGR